MMETLGSIERYYLGYLEITNVSVCTENEEIVRELVWTFSCGGWAATSRLYWRHLSVKSRLRRRRMG